MTAAPDSYRDDHSAISPGDCGALKAPFTRRKYNIFLFFKDLLNKMLYKYQNTSVIRFL